MSYLQKKATLVLTEADLKKLRKQEEAKKVEEAKEVLGLPSTGTALLGAGLGLVGTKASEMASDAYALNLLNKELTSKFDSKASRAVEDLLVKDNVKFLDSLSLAPGAINSMHPIMLNAFKALPENEKRNILMRGGNLSPFALTEDNIIWRGLADKVSAGTLAHEYGHILNQRARKNTITEKLTPALYNIGAYAPLAAAGTLSLAGLLGAKDKTLLYGGLLGTAAGLPRLVEELKASYKGSKFLKQHNISDANGPSAWAGIPTYLVPTLLPLLPFLTRKLSRRMLKKRKNKSK